MKVKHLTSQLIVLAGKESDSIVHSIPDEPQKPAEGFKWEAVMSGIESKA